MAIFLLKLWVNPFGKISIVRLFEPVVFIRQKGVFLFWNIVKHIFLAYIGKKKDMEKWPFFDQNHGLTPLEKAQFFDFLNVLFLQPRKTVFRSKISLNTCSWLILPKKKVRKMAIFGPKPWVNSFGNIYFFLLFDLVVF